MQYGTTLKACKIVSFDPKPMKLRNRISRTVYSQKKRYRMRTNREAMSVISVFQVKLNLEFTRQSVNFFLSCIAKHGSQITDTNFFLS